jgi:hypothetical protein
MAGVADHRQPTPRTAADDLGGPVPGWAKLSGQLFRRAGERPLGGGGLVRLTAVRRRGGQGTRSAANVDHSARA